VSFTPTESAVYRELDGRLNPFTCRTRETLEARLKDCDVIERWMQNLSRGELKTAYKRLLPYMKKELLRHVEESEQELKSREIASAMPRPPR
jgi:DNA-binding IscR family transcriptional regulator